MRQSDLTDVHTSLEPVFGGKATGLGRLIRAGARVPQGFAVEATVAPPDRWPKAAREELLRRAAPLLQAGAVAVRSSAPGEDSAARSFAGMFETVLGVRDVEGLLAAAARCVASGGSERARSYARVTSPLPVGLVVQSQVSPRAAGVCFTVDPAGKDRAVLVEAVVGAGDALVSGRVPPERWRVYRSGLGRWEPHRDPRSPVTVLAEGEAAALAEGAAALAERLGHPLDLEWALDNHLWWLQARPVTAAAEPVAVDVERFSEDADDGPVTVWSNWNVRETMPLPMPALAWTLWRDVILPAAMEPLFPAPPGSLMFRHALAIDLVQGRIYWNMNGLFAAPFLNRVFRLALARIDARAARIVDDLFARGVLRPRRLPGSAPGRTLGLAWVFAKGAFRMLGAIRPRKVLSALETWGAAIARRPAVPTLSDEELLREMRLLGEPESRPIARGQSALVVAFFWYAAAEHAFRHHPEAHRLLVAGIPGNPTTAISLGIDGLVEAARPLAAVFREPLAPVDLLVRLEREPGGTDWLARFREFLARFGQRCPGEFDLSAPRWSEDPSMIVGLVRAGLLSPPGERATDRLAREAQRRRAAVDAAVAVSQWWRRPWLRFLARQVALAWPLREAPKHYAMVVFARMRAAFLEIGSRLAQRGAIDAPDDVLFLERAEVEALVRGGPGGDSRRRVGERRARHQHHCAHPAPDFVRSDGVPVLDDAETSLPADGVLRGAGASGGSARGPVRILRAPDPEAMADGDVIVMEFADPGWTPLFPRARAVVMDVGGTLCHAAVVARELGIPAVFGVAGATRLLVDGQRVRVDGDRGEVRVESEE